jgi:hypothetical protein
LQKEDLPEAIALTNCVAGFHRMVSSAFDQLLDFAPEPSR